MNFKILPMHKFKNRFMFRNKVDYITEVQLSLTSRKHNKQVETLEILSK